MMPRLIVQRRLSSAPVLSAGTVLSRETKGVVTMTRWLIACVASLVAPALLLATPGLGDHAGTAAVTIVTTLVFASVLALCSCADAFGASATAFLAEPNDEDQHRRGAFRRQYAPGTPGRPGRPRAPGHRVVGLAR